MKNHMPYNPAEYLDNITKEQIKDAVRYFLEAGVENHDEIVKIIAKDFGVTRTAVKEMIRDITKPKTNKF